jgi:membrane protease YdiL (CAAX protease family)
VTPLPFWRSLPFFAVPSLIMTLVIYLSIPAFDRAGIPLLWNFAAHVGLVFGGLGVLACVRGRRELLPGQSLRERLWLAPLRPSDAVIGLAIGGIGLFCYLQLQFTVPAIMGRLPFSPPSFMNDFAGDGLFLRTPMAGAWWLLPIYMIIYVCNVFGEELWWRGYLLPRQDAALGYGAALANGLLWPLFHVFFAWDIVTLLPIALMISFAALWRRSTWVAVIGHGVLNSLPWFFLIPGVASAGA